MLRKVTEVSQANAASEIINDSTVWLFWLKVHEIPPKANVTGIFWMSAIPVSTRDRTIYIKAEINRDGTIARGMVLLGFFASLV